MAHSKEVLQRFAEPQYVLSNTLRHSGRAGSRVAGALIEMHLAQQGRILQARFKAYGCPATIAGADWLAQRLDGTALDATLPDRHDIIRALQLGPARQHCAALAIEAMLRAIEALKN